MSGPQICVLDVENGVEKGAVGEQTIAALQAPAAEGVVFAVYLVALEVEGSHPLIGDCSLHLEDLRVIGRIPGRSARIVVEHVDLGRSLCLRVMVVENEIRLVSRARPLGREENADEQRERFGADIGSFHLTIVPDSGPRKEAIMNVSNGDSVVKVTSSLGQAGRSPPPAA